MTSDRRCEEILRGQRCNRPALWVVGLDVDGRYLACAEHAKAWAADLRAPLDRSLTPLQDAIRNTLGIYEYACRSLTAAERDTLRDILAARLAMDYLADASAFDEWRERAA